mmetsp:Transcript_39663/g.99707  ORF Transcript_39663/g.99707 Transcript_39663/m.99707 type:complete len:256 (+) Transcript_39663:519-1286(+)
MQVPVSAALRVSVLIMVGVIVGVFVMVKLIVGVLVMARLLLGVLIVVVLIVGSLIMARLLVGVLIVVVLIVGVLVRVARIVVVLVVLLLDVNATHHVHHPDRLVSVQRRVAGLAHQLPHMLLGALSAVGETKRPASWGVGRRGAGAPGRGVAGMTRARTAAADTAEHSAVAAAPGRRRCGRRREKQHHRHHHQADRAGCRLAGPAGPVAARGALLVGFAGVAVGVVVVVMVVRLLGVRGLVMKVAARAHGLVPRR